MKKFFGKQRRSVLKQAKKMLTSISEAEGDLFVLADEWDNELADNARPYIELYYKSEANKFHKRVGASPDFFSVVNPRLQDAIDKASLKFAKSTNETTSMLLSDALSKLRDELRQGLVIGDSLRELTKRVNEVFDHAETTRAVTIAATEASRAVHDAQVISGEASGVVVGWRWLLSEDACEQCIAVAEGNPIIPLGGSFAKFGDDPEYSDVQHPPLHPNCFLGETPILAASVRRTIIAKYSGPVVRIVTECGNVTVTCNHLFLTPSGFARASSLREGDQILHYIGFQGPFFCDPNNYECPSPIEDVIASLTKSGRMSSVSVPIAAEYLHGDGAFSNGNINIKTSNGFLLRDGKSRTYEQFGKTCFNWANTELPGFAKSSHLASVLLSLRAATDGGVGVRRESKSFRLRHRSHADRYGFRQSTDLNVRPNEYSANCTSADTGIGGKLLFSNSNGIESSNGSSIKFEPASRTSLLSRSRGNAHSSQSSLGCVSTNADRLSQALKRFSGEVSCLPITRIEFFHWSGPVYDLETVESLYVAGGLITSNCMCALTEILDNDPEAADLVSEPSGKRGGAAAYAPVEIG